MLLYGPDRRAGRVIGNAFKNDTPHIDRNIPEVIKNGKATDKEQYLFNVKHG